MVCCSHCHSTTSGFLAITLKRTSGTSEKQIVRPPGYSTIMDLHLYKPGGCMPFTMRPANFTLPGSCSWHSDRLAGSSDNSIALVESASCTNLATILRNPSSVDSALTLTATQIRSPARYFGICSSTTRPPFPLAVAYSSHYSVTQQGRLA